MTGDKFKRIEGGWLCLDCGKTLKESGSHCCEKYLRLKEKKK